MSVLFSFENCALISHEDFINHSYSETISNGDALCKYKINSDLFELNVPYRTKSDEDAQTKKRHRKIINRTKLAVAQEHHEEFELVFEIENPLKLIESIICFVCSLLFQ